MTQYLVKGVLWGIDEGWVILQLYGKKLMQFLKGFSLFLSGGGVKTSNIGNNVDLIPKPDLEGGDVLLMPREAIDQIHSFVIILL